MPILDSDEKILEEAIDSLADRGVLGYERFEEESRFIYVYSHHRARQQLEAIKRWRNTLKDSLRLARKFSTLIDDLLPKALPARGESLIESAKLKGIEP